LFPEEGKVFRSEPAWRDATPEGADGSARVVVVDDTLYVLERKLWRLDGDALKLEVDADATLLAMTRTSRATLLVAGEDGTVLRREPGGAWEPLESAAIDEDDSGRLYIVLVPFRPRGASATIDESSPLDLHRSLSPTYGSRSATAEHILLLGRSHGSALRVSTDDGLTFHALEVVRASGEPVDEDELTK